MAWPASARSRDTRLLALVAAFWAASVPPNSYKASKK